VKGFHSSEKYLKSDLIIVLTRFREQQKRNSKNAAALDARGFAGLQDLIDQVKTYGKKFIVFGNNVEISRINGKLLTDYLFSNLTDSKNSFSIKDLDDMKIETSRLVGVR